VANQNNRKKEEGEKKTGPPNFARRNFRVSAGNKKGGNTFHGPESSKRIKIPRRKFS